MSKTKAAIAIVDDDESVCRAISPLRASTCLAEKETSVQELFVWMIIPMTRLKRERVGGVGVITFHSRGTRGDYGYGQMQSWEILRAT